MRARGRTLIVCLWPRIYFEVPLLDRSDNSFVVELQILNGQVLVWLILILVDQDLCLLNDPLEDVHRHKFFDRVLLLVLLLVGGTTLAFDRTLLKRVAEAVAPCVNGDQWELGLFVFEDQLVQVPTTHNVEGLLTAQEFRCLLCDI